MAAHSFVRNPLEWAWDHLKQTGRALETTAHAMDDAWDGHDTLPPAVRRIGIDDLRTALALGFKDFAACRTDVVFLCLLYPLAGLVIARMALDHGLIPLIFPLVAGFALIAPLFGVGLYEISRRRELGYDSEWTDVFGVVRSPSIGGILVVGLILLALFCLWLLAANFIYTVTLGPDAPASRMAFIHDALTTPQGWTMIAVGMATGFVFALAVLVISIVSIPLLLDRNVGVATAIGTSVQAVWINRGLMAVWGLVVAAGLAIGALPLLIGLAVAMPVLGHATWHLYRRIVI